MMTWFATRLHHLLPPDLDPSEPSHANRKWGAKKVRLSLKCKAVHGAMKAGHVPGGDPKLTQL